MTKRTPGPWEVLPAEDGVPYLRVRGTILGQQYKICNVHVDQCCPEEGKANADLIAATTEILEALEMVATIARGAYRYWFNDIDAKVGKILLALSGDLPGYDKRIDEIHAAIAKAKGEQK